ncbi:hypothetical protein OAF83_02560 [Rubripirellula sp.]|nr:hypothetical protein [Rubripirellula sp.]MDB4749767.1 hypothetical protein [Rubripirellula sp.]
MYQLLAEEPLIVSLMLGTMGFGLLYGWLRSGNKPAAIAGLVFVALIPLAWFIADQVETDSEHIERLIYTLADAVERNDHDRAVAVIADPELEARARLELQNWVFGLAKVTQISKIRVIQDTYPPQADIEMMVKVRVTGKADSAIQNAQIPRKLLLTMEKDGDDWLITEYQHLPIIGGPDNFSAYGGGGQPPQGN